MACKSINERAENKDALPSHCTLYLKTVSRGYIEFPLASIKLQRGKTSQNILWLEIQFHHNKKVKLPGSNFPLTLFFWKWHFKSKPPPTLRDLGGGGIAHTSMDSLRASVGKLPELTSNCSIACRPADRPQSNLTSINFPNFTPVSSRWPRRSRHPLVSAGFTSSCLKRELGNRTCRKWCSWAIYHLRSNSESYLKYKASKWMSRRSELWSCLILVSLWASDITVGPNGSGALVSYITVKYGSSFLDYIFHNPQLKFSQWPSSAYCGMGMRAWLQNLLHTVNSIINNGS